MRYVYIAGPYTGATHDYRSYFEIDRHIMAATEVAAELVHMGYGFFNPHRHSAHFEVITPEVGQNYWYELDLHFLRSCDAVLLLPGWEESVGTRREVEEADRLGIPCFEHIEELAAALPANEQLVDNLDSKQQTVNVLFREAQKAKADNERLRQLATRLAQGESGTWDGPMNQDEMGGCVWCAGPCGLRPGASYEYATRSPRDHYPDCPWIEARALLHEEEE